MKRSEKVDVVREVKRKIVKSVEKEEEQCRNRCGMERWIRRGNRRY